MNGSTEEDDPSTAWRRNRPASTIPLTETENFPTKTFFRKRRRFFGSLGPASIRRDPVLPDPFRRDPSPTGPGPPWWLEGKRPDGGGQCCRRLQATRFVHG